MKSNSIGPGTIAVVALAVLWSPVAHAQTIYLKCGDYSSPFVVDLTAKTVNGVPATITPVSIDWDRNSPSGTVHGHYHIDRSVGTLTTSLVYYSAQGVVPTPTDTNPCTSIAAPQTKF